MDGEVRALEGWRIAGAEGALGEALRAEIPRLLRLAERLSGDPWDAEDLTQEALLRALRRRPDLGDPGWRRAWLTRILINLWRDRLRTLGRRREALASLPPLQRAAMVLAVDGGWSVAEIARILGSTPTRVKANLWHARRRLKERLADLLDGEG